MRVDTGVYEGDEISMYYDSMIAKLITHGGTRDQAIARMRDALNAFVIRGISSNIAFQAALMQHPRFVAGNFHTGFIAEEFPKGFHPIDLVHEDPLLLAAGGRLRPPPLHRPRGADHRAAQGPRAPGRLRLGRPDAGPAVST